ncbi:FAD-dependent oxidoreductase [Kitasatospora sp. NPDC006697]|uniref:FAD-dependent oxidoreductase n=1 Tax=Kitasatospora sp. NPDC006697 TaxID=3364020 RepID=UPI0036C0D8A3
MSGTTRAVVLGGGLAGLLAATVLARHVDQVTVVDRDSLPAGPEPRKGVPQGRHAHLLWSGGARAIEALLPGTTERWLAAGARQVSVHQDMLSLTAYGWQHRFPGTQFMIACSRPLLDQAVREAVLAEPRITLRERTGAQGLLGDPERVTGVLVQGEEVAADLVVDATGRGSRLEQWLPALGLPVPEIDRVDPGIVYATRIYRAPHGMAAAFPVVSVYADHRDGRPGRNGVVLPIEGDRWMVTLSGTRNGEPGGTEAEFTAFANALRHPVVAGLIAGAEPLTGVQRTRSTASRRLFCERAERWPAGLLAIGDALAALNPVYGHGMSAAALEAVALDGVLAADGLGGAATARAQQAIARAVDDPWIFAASQDICYPDCRTEVGDPRLTVQAGERRRFAELIGATAIRSPALSAATTAVSTLSAPSGSLEDAAVLAELRKGPQRPELVQPPLKASERELLARCVGEPVA